MECYVKYIINNYSYDKIGLIPGRFAPPHKGHFSIFKKVTEEMDKTVIIIFDTDDTKVPLNIRAQWIKKSFPNAIIIEAKNCPDGKKYAYELGQECANIQNDYIRELLDKIKITHVYHSNPCGNSLSKALNAIDVLVDLNREKEPISATMIRENIEKYSHYLKDYIYEEYKQYNNY